MITWAAIMLALNAIGVITRCIRAGKSGYYEHPELTAILAMAIDGPPAIWFWITYWDQIKPW